MTKVAEDDIPPGFEAYYHPGPFGELVGPYYHKDLSDGGFIRAFRALEKHINQVGLVQGGMLCTFTDQLITTSLIRAGIEAVTVNLNISFMSSVKLGEWVEGLSEITREGGRVVWARGVLTSGDKTVLTAQGLWQKVSFGEGLIDRADQAG
ncbi:MAG: PaaI family thioesterase [Alphaproteobacteria bacterium]|nr:PaaI family thioesterase [Alphaproteobacteria bacterium]MCY4499058.1 PaaI family thioesterase [Rhodospirillaceae bacterium]